MIARRLKWYLDSHGVDYDLIHHAYASTMAESAEAAHIPAGRVAKCVLLEDERGYLLVVVPASCRVQLEALDQALGRHLELASEDELDEIFQGCGHGALPPIGAAYNIPMAIDQSLLRLADVYFEAGDHEELVHVSAAGFRELLPGARPGKFGRPH
jgi:Ala-tRNA(Pro) deacylase